MALIASQDLEIRSRKFKNPLDLLQPEIQQLEEEHHNKTKTAEMDKIARNAEERRSFSETESASNKLETKTINELRMPEAGKQIRSVLYLALGSKGETIFSLKFEKVKILRMNFAEF